MIFAWDIPSAVTEAECERLAELASGRRVLEIGSFLGRSTIALASTAEQVVSVDWHQGDEDAGWQDTLRVFQYNLARYHATNVKVVVARIEDADLEGGFDLVFVDAAHDDDSVAIHWQIACSLVKDDGVVAFHDYGRFNVQAILDESGEWEVVETLAVHRLTATPATIAP